MRRFSVPALAVFLLAPSSTAQPDPNKFIDDAEARLLTLTVDASRADWVKSTFITGDTEILAAKADERLINATVELAKQSARFDLSHLPDNLARKIRLLKLSLDLATPANPRESEELTRIVASMEGAYGRAKYCPEPGKCLELEPDLTRIMASSRNPNELRDAWRGWHDTAAPVR
jgi:peptidyl-dipeptidase A